MPRGQGHDPLFSRAPLKDARKLGSDPGRVVSLLKEHSQARLREKGSKSLFITFADELEYDMRQTTPGVNIYIAGFSSIFPFRGSTTRAGSGWTIWGENPSTLHKPARYMNAWVPDRSFKSIRDKEKIFYLDDENSWVEWPHLYRYVRDHLLEEPLKDLS